MALAALAQNYQTPQSVPSKQKFCVISANKGGVGKTTIAFNLAIAAAYEGYRVAVLDLDAQHGAEFLKNVRSQKSNLLPSYDVFSFDMAHAERAVSAIGGYDLVIVDCPPGVEKFESQVKYLIDRADFVFVPTGAGVLDIRACSQWLNKLKPLKPHHLAFIMNRVKPNTIAYRQASTYLADQGRVLESGVRDLQVIQESQKTGRSVFDNLATVEDQPERKRAQIHDQVHDLKRAWLFLKAEVGL